MFNLEMLDANATWVKQARQFNLLDIVTMRKLNHEETDASTRKLVDVSRRVNGNSKNWRIFCSVMSMINSREFLAYVGKETVGKNEL